MSVVGAAVATTVKAVVASIAVVVELRLNDAEIVVSCCLLPLLAIVSAAAVVVVFVVVADDVDVVRVCLPSLQLQLLLLMVLVGSCCWAIILMIDGHVSSVVGR